MWDQVDSFHLAGYVLHEIVRDMSLSKSGHEVLIEWEKEIVGIEKTATKETIDNMRSHVGIFDQAAIVGACLTSGFVESNVDILMDDEHPEKIKKEIAKFSSLFLAQMHKKIGQILPDDGRSKEQLVKFGFQTGLDFGRCIRNTTVYAPMTGEKMKEAIEAIKIDPTLIMRGKKTSLEPVTNYR